MNVQGCPPNYATDTTLSVGLNLSTLPTCEVPIPLYLTILILNVLVLAFAAIIRSKLYIKRKRNPLSKKNHTRSGEFQAVFMLMRSWAMLIIVLLYAIVPFLIVTDNNSHPMVVLLGLDYLLFSIQGERWLVKLVRLGQKLLPQSNSKSSSNKENTMMTETGDEPNAFLMKQDFLLKALTYVMRANMVFQFIFLCILVPGLVIQRYWLQIGIGLIAVYLCASTCAINYQYYRCSAVLAKSERTQREYLVAGNTGKVSQVNKVFRKHQFLLTMSCFVTSTVSILFAFEVLPLNWILIMVITSLSTFVNGSLLLTFIHKPTKVPRQEYTQSSVIFKNPNGLTAATGISNMSQVGASIN